MTTTESIQPDTEREGASVERIADDASTSTSSSSEQTDAPSHLVPVAEAKKYRKRAQQAEQSLTEIQQQLEQKSQQVTELERTVADLERRRTIDQLLIEAEAIDLESARLLTMATVEQMDEPDVTEAVDELRRSKPFLFRAKGSANGATNMSARIDASPGANDSLDHAAAEAHATGDRNDLLRYLRLRRKRT